MEDSSNGKLEVTKEEEEEAQYEEKVVLIEDSEELKPDEETLRETIIVDENSIDAKANSHEGVDSSSSSSSSDEEESKPDEKNSEEVVYSEKVKEEDDKSFESVVKSVEPVLPSSEENISVSDGGLGLKEIKEQKIPNMNGNNDSSMAATVVEMEETEETSLANSDGKIGESSGNVDLEYKENVDNKLQPDENNENPSDFVDLDSKQNLGELSEKPADLPIPESEIPESVINQPIFALAPRARQMTSWRSCCGLFDVLRRSN